MEAGLKGEPRFRRHKGWAGTVEKVILSSIPIAGIIFILNIPSYLGVSFYLQQYLAIFLSLSMAAIFLVVPAGKKVSPDKLPWYDRLFALLSLLVGGYIAIFYSEIVVTMGLLLPFHLILGTICIILILEGTRRLLGWPFLTIVFFFIFYAHFSDFFPGALYGRGVPWPRLVNYLYLDPHSVFGIPLQVAATVVLSFIFFGRALFSTGGGQFFTNLALAIMGRYRGGPAKVAVVASSIFGTMSGSAVANVVTTGSVTIPLMKDTGYKAHFAGAVEATASSGGQIMPPVMGAAAFLMATFLGVPYSQVAIAAIVPAILYYFGVFIQVDLRAAKDGLKGLEKEKLPSFRNSLTQGWLFIIPIVVLIYALFILRLEPELAGLYSVAPIFLISLIKKATRLNFRKFLTILEDTGEGLLEVAIISAAAGLIIGIVTLTGLGFTFSQALVNMCGGNLLVLLILAAIGAIILGMGMTVTAAYILIVILIAPALVKLGIEPLTAHLFVFYFAVLSFLTPPVCLAVYAAAAMAGADQIKTAFQAMRLGIAAYLVPFVFAYHPSLLLQGPWFEVIEAIITAVIGIALIAVAVEGFLFQPLGWFKRILLSGGGLLSLVPGWKTDLLGLAIAIPVVIWEWRINSLHQKEMSSSNQFTPGANQKKKLGVRQKWF